MADTHPPAAPRAVTLADLAPEYYSAHRWRMFSQGEGACEEAICDYTRLYGVVPEFLVVHGLHLFAGPIRRAEPAAPDA
jgi:hypothetical protein